MTIKWKITKINQQEGCVEVLWLDKDDHGNIVGSYGPYNLSIPLINGAYPQGENLKRVIDGYTPLGEIERSRLMKQGAPSMAHIEELIGQEQVADLSAFVVQVKQQAVDPVAQLATVEVL